MLREFLRICLPESHPEKFKFDDKWLVRAETRMMSGRDQIDILVTRTVPDSRFALIIENKVKGAGDQQKWLERYVQALMVEENFGISEIWVLYMPLSERWDHEPEGLDVLLPGHYNQITFDKHILEWLKCLLDNGSGISGGMHENLCHYRNLILHLIDKNKEKQMNTEIIHAIQEAERAPTWSDVKKLAEAAGELKACLESKIRGEVFLCVRDQLKSKAGIAAWIEPFESIDSEEQPPLQIKAIDQRFANDVSMYLRHPMAGLARVGLCVTLKEIGQEGANPVGLWIAIWQRPAQDDGELSLKSKLRPITEGLQPHPEHPWVWLEQRFDYDGFQANFAALVGEIVGKLRALHDGLTQICSTELGKPTT